MSFDFFLSFLAKNPHDIRHAIDIETKASRIYDFAKDLDRSIDGDGEGPLETLKGSLPVQRDAAADAIGRSDRNSDVARDVSDI